MTRKKKKEPYLAPGKEELLNLKATKEEIKKGEYTRVTTLSYDEVDPS